MAPHGNKLSEDLNKIIIALHKDSVRLPRPWNWAAARWPRPYSGLTGQVPLRTGLVIVDQRSWVHVFIEGTMKANIYCDILKHSIIPSLRRLGRRAVFQHDNDPKHTSKMTTALLNKLRVKWKVYLTCSSSVMPLWGSRRGCLQQPVQLWWIPCTGGLRQCKIAMVPLQNIDTLDTVLTCSLRVYSFLLPVILPIMVICLVICRGQ